LKAEIDSRKHTDAASEAIANATEIYQELADDLESAIAIRPQSKFSWVGMSFGGQRCFTGKYIHQRR